MQFPRMNRTTGNTRLLTVQVILRSGNEVFLSMANKKNASQKNTVQKNETIPVTLKFSAECYRKEP